MATIKDLEEVKVPQVADERASMDEFVDLFGEEPTNESNEVFMQVGAEL